MIVCCACVIVYVCWSGDPARSAFCRVPRPCVLYVCMRTSVMCASECVHQYKSARDERRGRSSPTSMYCWGSLPGSAFADLSFSSTARNLPSPENACLKLYVYIFYKTSVQRFV